MQLNSINASSLANMIDGVLYGPDILLSGKYTFLNKASKNDIVIRHKIDDKGIKIAKNKGISCLITQNPQNDAVEVAKKLEFPLIVTTHIEYATAFALKNSVDNYASNAFKIAVTGTNGKSTTTHLLYTIFSDFGFNTYTNTDAESEGNTLIDPRVASELFDFYKLVDNIDVITLEVSEVQGWENKLMKNHALQMISALDSEAVIITNASMDHINLVNNFDNLLNEISGAATAINKRNSPSLLVLNYEDENIRNMSKIVENNENVDVMFFGNYDSDNILPISYKEGKGIYSYNELYVKETDLPFTSIHFIQDIMAALAVCIYKQLDQEKVIKSLRNYKPLARRFIKLKENPVIIDDFAHNPSGINLTIENGSKLGNNLFVVNAIRGSRGNDINKEIAEALVESLKDKLNYTLILTESVDVVNHLNTVLESEREIFLNILDENNIEYTLIESLEESLLKTVNLANEDDVILLLGAQGMDPAKELLIKNNII
ncbi:Mur ligase family protein [Methanosphaera sp. WGK6]|uniref:Mur ligase family protein n=1 Tax=Methanosphaera sp. WGK6 TaxID=1561964 RepID=UPI00084C9F3A|nr:Mur ligase family protein [Methanosphaera sp. WGK6]OED30710.1 hypothetical protein NL43_01885 [Methanosphaera sp. WGK6]